MSTYRDILSKPLQKKEDKFTEKSPSSVSQMTVLGSFKKKDRHEEPKEDPTESSVSYAKPFVVDTTNFPTIGSKKVETPTPTEEVKVEPVKKEEPKVEKPKPQPQPQLQPQQSKWVPRKPVGWTTCHSKYGNREPPLPYKDPRITYSRMVTQKAEGEKRRAEKKAKSMTADENKYTLLGYLLEAERKEMMDSIPKKEEEKDDLSNSNSKVQWDLRKVTADDYGGKVASYTLLDKKDKAQEVYWTPSGR